MMNDILLTLNGKPFPSNSSFLTPRHYVMDFALLPEQAIKIYSKANKKCNFGLYKASSFPLFLLGEI